MVLNGAVVSVWDIRSVLEKDGLFDSLENSQYLTVQRMTGSKFSVHDSTNAESSMCSRDKKQLLEANDVSSSGTYAVACALGNPVTARSLIDLNRPADASEVVSVSPLKTTDQQSKEWFLRLQERLRKFDESSSDKYEQMLRYSSTVGLSRIASELEEKALRLAQEECKELQRMKDLNIWRESPSRK